MALLGSAAASGSTMGLTPAYINTLIRGTISAQRQPIYRLTARKDQLNIKKAIYSDMKNKLLALKSIATDLDNDDGSSIFDNRAITSSDTDVLTATVSSEAIRGEYTMTVTNLAEAHMVRSDQQTDNSSALNMSGTFTLNSQVITVDTDDSLSDIVEAINAAAYEDGSEAMATIVDNYLVLEAGSTGTSSQLTASDTTGTVLSDLGVLNGGSFKTTLQAAEDASFTVNGIAITRESNLALDDVIDGVTLNLVAETSGADTVSLDVTPDYTAIRSKISALVNNLNSVSNYLKAKTGITVDQEKEKYTRGALAGDTIFSMLRTNLIGTVREQTPVAPPMGDPTYLSDVGITIGNKLVISLDTDELNSAMESDLDAVAQLFDGIMDRFLYTLEPFTTEIASSNTLDLYSTSIDTRMDNIGVRIDRMEKLLVVKEEMLIQRYSSLYLQNLDFTQQQYGMLGIYSNFSARA